MYGKPQTFLVEWGFSLVLDQIKSFPVQVLIYWVVIRRCGKMPITAEFGGKWDDETIF
jgi:hypothetical protein